MRIPLMLGLVAVGLVAFKVLTISTLVVGLLVLAPIVLTFVIIGVLLFGLVSVGMLGIRFMLFCLKGYGPSTKPAVVAPPRPAGPAPAPPLRAAGPPPLRGPRPDWHRTVRGIGYGRRRRHFSWVWLVLGIVAVVFLVRGNSHTFRSAFDSHTIRVVKPPIRFGKHPVATQERGNEEIGAIEKHPAPRPAPAPIAQAPSAPAEIEPAVVESPPAPESASLARKAAESAATMVNGIRKAWTFSGGGLNVEDAKKVALDKAEDEVHQYLREQNPPVQWMPDQFYIEEHLVKSRNEEPPLKLDGEKIRQVSLGVKITTEDYRDILQHDRQYTMQQRLLGTAAILGGLLALFAAVAGYIRLDEWSKGYYTWWLRFGVLGFLGVAGAGLLLYFVD